MHRFMIVVALVGTLVLTGCQTMTGRTAGAVADDSGATAAVKSKLVGDRLANLTSVGVDTVNGVTYLTGVVETPEQRLRAEQFAWEVPGVRQVVNNIQVQRSPVAVAPSASPIGTASRHAIVGTVSGIDVTRSQVTVASGTQQLLLQLPPSVVRDLRLGDRITLNVDVQSAR